MIHTAKLRGAKRVITKCTLIKTVLLNFRNSNAAKIVSFKPNLLWFATKYIRRTAHGQKMNWSDIRLSLHGIE